MSDSVQPHRRQPTRLPHPWDSPGKNTGVGCHFLLQCMKVKSESEVVQSCLTLSDPMDCSLPGSSVHGVYQARVLEWVAIVSLTEGIWKSWMKWRTRHVHVCWKSGELDLCLILLSSISEEWYVNWVLFLSILWKLLITFSPLSECLSRMKIPLVK